MWLLDLWHHQSSTTTADDNYSYLGISGNTNNIPVNFDGTSIWAQHRPFSHSTNRLLNCFYICHNNIRQYIAKRKIERGCRLYENHYQSAAVRLWLSALKSTIKHEDRFLVLGYIYQAHMDWGKFR